MHAGFHHPQHPEQTSESGFIKFKISKRNALLHKKITLFFVFSSLAIEIKEKKIKLPLICFQTALQKGPGTENTSNHFIGPGIGVTVRKTAESAANLSGKSISPTFCHGIIPPLHQKEIIRRKTQNAEIPGCRSPMRIPRASGKSQTDRPSSLRSYRTCRRSPGGWW